MIRLTAIWSYSRLHNDLLGNMKLTAIWSVPGFTVIVDIELLHVVSRLRDLKKLSCYLIESRLQLESEVYRYLVGSRFRYHRLYYHLVESRFHSN